MIGSKWCWALAVLSCLPVLPLRSPLLAQNPPAVSAPTASAEAPRPTGTEAIQQPQPAFYVRAAVDHEDRLYRANDTLAVKVVSEVDAYLYVLYQQADGKVYQCFPNSSQTENRVKAKQMVTIGQGDDSFRWVVGPPFGKELIKVIASREPIADLSKAAMMADRFNPVSGNQLKGVALELEQAQPVGWSECVLEITTAPAQRPSPQPPSPQPPSPQPPVPQPPVPQPPVPQPPVPNPQTRRFGVFFGVDHYEFNAEYEQTTGKPINLRGCGNDARQMGKLLKQVGGLQEAQVFVDRQATRRNFEIAVTEWLPSVTRPGDTAFIYFSGHGSQIPDDNGDEADGQDEFLLPYDFMSPQAFITLRDRLKAGKLEQRLVQRVSDAVQLVQSSASEQQAVDRLIRTTGLTDDLFGHWLQRLDGRQVVVILDACHSGGFATQGKGLEGNSPAINGNARPKPLGFDFLDGEIGRLKDIGQRESALFAACHANELSQVSREKEISVMTDALLGSIEAARRPLEIKQAYVETCAGVDQYSQRTHEAGFRPYLVNYCTKPVYLRP